MIVKNRPSNYFKRSDLPGKQFRVKTGASKQDRLPKARDFATADIDSSFYFTFATDHKRK